jgi:hypothetical protein
MPKKKDTEEEDGGDQSDQPQLPTRLIRGGVAYLTHAIYNSNEKRRHLGNVPKRVILYNVTGGAEGESASPEGATEAQRERANGILFFFDCTPTDQKGKKFSGNDPAWKKDPQPSAGGLAASHGGGRVQQYIPDRKGTMEGAITPLRLCAPDGEIIHADIDPAQQGTGDASADLNREYINFGCTPVINAEADMGQGAVILIEGFHGPDYEDGEGFALIPVQFKLGGKVYDVTKLLIGRGA